MDLPDVLDWPEQTRVWWQAWHDSSLSKDWTPLDWQFLLDTAVIHAQFWSGDTSVAGELRARQSKIGATADDRARLQVLLGQNVKEEKKIVTGLDEFTKKLEARRAKNPGRAAR